MCDEPRKQVPSENNYSARGPPFKGAPIKRDRSMKPGSMIEHVKDIEKMNN